MTQPNITPEGFRTAAYLATKARLDVARSRTGKTRKQVTCTPPNVKCGGRCIPPNWDCRLKGQGADPQLRAVQTDPVGGLANIERGVKRIGKGITKGSFSEIEGGKRAIVRGVVKATPGDIQRKKELAAKLERRAGGIAAALAVVGFGLFSHNQLKRAPFYRDGVGRQIDDAVAGGINRILDVTPGIRGARAERRAAGAAAAGAVVARAAGEAARGPEAMRAGLMRTPGQLEHRGIEYGNARVLLNKLTTVDIDARARSGNADTWRQQSLEAFWGASRTNAAGAGDGSTFSEPATHAFLSQQFGFRVPPGADATQVRRSIASALSREAASLQALARQEKVDLNDNEARGRFLSRLVGPSTENFPESVREKALTNLDKILGGAPSSRAAAVSRKQLADTLYRETRDGFDQYFKRVADEVRQTPGAALGVAERRAGYGDLQNSARIGHARYLAARLNKNETISSRMGQGLSDAVAQEYFARQVMESSRFTLSDRVTRAAASELAGRDITSLSEARQYLQNNGFERLEAVQRAAGAAPPRGRRGTQAQITERAQALRAAARARGEEMSMEAAYRAARAEGTRSSNPSSSTSSPRRASQLSEEELMRNAPPGVDARAWARRMMRGDALPPGLIRTATYLAVRADLRGEGKPCGASHIPKAHTCTKGQGSVEKKERQLYEKSATKEEKAYVEKHGMPKDTLSLVEAQLELEKENTKPSGRGKKLALAVGGAALLAGGALAYKNRKPIAAAAGKLNTERKAQTERVVAELSKNTIKTLSRDDVDAGIAKLPKKFQEPVRQLVGDAKVSAAHLALKTKGGQITSVDVDNNFSNWKMPDGTLLSTGSVKDTLVIYNTKPQASIGGAQTFATQFRVDGEFDAKSASASRNATSVVSTVKKMFQAQMEQIPDNSIITAIPYANDKKERQRRAIYQRYGFRQASASDERLFAMKTKGKFTKMQDSHLEQIADLIRNDTKLDKEDSRLGKPCGASHIPKAHTCTKGQEVVKQPEQQTTKSNKAAKIAIGVGVAAVGALAVTAALDAHRFLKPRDLPAPTSFKSVVQTQRKQAGTKLTSGEALGRHYDAEVSAGRLKAGDVVYTVQHIRGNASSGRHFAVYLGKTGDNHQFMEMTRVRGDLNRGQAMLTEFGATAGRPAYAAVYAKAPGMKQDKQISINEIKNRAYSLMGSEMQYHQLDSNCETFARMIAAGNPRSRQVDKLSALTKSIYRGLDRYLDEDRPVNLPTIKEQARILDYKQRVAEGDREARKELKAFTTLIAKRKQRNDAVEDLFTDLPSPTELLRGSKSEVEDAIRIKLYLMLLLTRSRALMKRATP